MDQSTLRPDFICPIPFTPIRALPVIGLLGWHEGNNHWNIAVTGTIPTGVYDPNKIAFMGLHRPGAVASVETREDHSMISWEYDSLATFDIRQTDNAIAYIRQHARDQKPFFMDVNFIKMHNPTNAAPEFRGRSHLGDYSDSLMELPTLAGSWMPSARRHPIRSSSSRPITAPG